MGGGTGKGEVTAYVIAFEPLQNVSYKINNVGCNPVFSCDPTNSYVLFYLKYLFTNSGTDDIIIL